MQVFLVSILLTFNSCLSHCEKQSSHKWGIKQQFNSNAAIRSQNNVENDAIAIMETGIQRPSQLLFTYSKSVMRTLEKGLKYAQS